MLSIRSSKAAKPNRDFDCRTRPGRQDNLTWLRHSLKRCRHETLLILVGGRDAAHVRLRMAQSDARDDLTPSHWSHVLLSTQKDFPSAWEVPLAAERSLSFPPATNGVQKTSLQSYAAPNSFPNIALIAVPAATADVRQAVARFQRERPALDAVELMVLWLAYLWGTGNSTNPLPQGQGMPSAAMVEYVLGGVGVDITPGLGSRSSCPEAIWQSARWWQEYHAREEGKSLSGAFFIGHNLV